MSFLLILLIFIFFISLSGFGQKGKTLIERNLPEVRLGKKEINLAIQPVNSTAAYIEDFYTITIYNEDNSLKLAFGQEKEGIRKNLTDSLLNLIINLEEKYANKKEYYGLAYLKIEIICGKKTNKFRTPKEADDEIIKLIRRK